MDNFLEFEQPVRDIEQKIVELKKVSEQLDVDFSANIGELQKQIETLKRQIYSNLTPWQRVQLARNAGRPDTMDMIAGFVEGFQELHGDRYFGDDAAIVCGPGTIGGHRVMFIGQRKGKNTKDRLKCNFGSPHPEGYRKALRKMKIAEKFHLPVVCLINTPGAYPGIGAEERGQANAIAENIFEMSLLRTPIVCIVIGEGGSGGALGIGVGDRLAIQENAYFSVISPEGCAAILWKSSDKAPQAADVLKLTPKDLIRLKIFDDIIPEPVGGAHTDPAAAMATVKDYIVKTLDALKAIPMDELIERRYQKYRHIGVYIEQEQEKISRLTPGRTGLDAELPTPGEVAAAEMGEGLEAEDADAPGRRTSTD
ncbi:MAG: acetyl-CoA carboxylase carboxyltransferase subunit alpha [Candidatus Brocadiae bacterium]|nr:acetyl-CoA carboxylase carboxyltransferase subunit alpha [Candidatus Brocadiia bacterium]